MAGTEFYEVRCENCRTSFPPEAKRCVHCGGPLGRGLAALLSQRRAADGEPEFVLEEAVEEEQEVQTPGRSLLWVITAAIAVGISMLRSCMEG
jgi:hypothetical protein